MNKRKLISVLTPAYNAGSYIYRLLDSILIQTYPRVSMIVVDDGSTDNTEDVVKSYIPKFKERGYDLKICSQENSGQSAAINKGLKYVEGDYLVWPDSDDWYASDDALSQLADILEANSDIAVVRCQLQFFSEKTLQLTPTTYKKYEKDDIENLFEDCLFAKNGFWFQPGGYMVRVADIDRLIPQRNIYVHRKAGQNWQLMLPLLYNSTCYTLKDKLYNVLVRQASHSHVFSGNYKKTMEMMGVYEETIVETLKSMHGISNQSCDEYIRQIQLKYLRQKFFLSIDVGQRNDIERFASELKEIGELTYFNRLEARIPIFYKFSVICRNHYYRSLRLLSKIKERLWK